MKITFSKRNNKDIAVLPFVGEDSFTIELGEATTETFDTLKYGNLAVMGQYGLSRITIDTILPAHKYPFVEAEAFDDPMEYVDFLDSAKQDRKPVRVVITRNDESTIINILTAVESISIKPPMRNGDIPFSVSLVEYRKL